MAEASRTGPEAAPVPGPLQCSVSVSGPRCGGEERGACTRIMIGDNDSWDPEHFKYHIYILDRIYLGRWVFNVHKTEGIVFREALKNNQ